MALACCVFPEFAVLSKFQVKKHGIQCRFLVWCHRPLDFFSKVLLCTKNSEKNFGTEKKNVTRVVIGCRSKNAFWGPQQPHVTFPGMFDPISKIQTGGHHLSLIWPHLSKKWLNYEGFPIGHKWPSMTPPNFGPCPGDPRDPKAQTPPPKCRP